MMFILSLFFVLIFCSLSRENPNHILIIAPPFFGHMIPSLELAKQLSSYCHVTYLISANKINELDRKGFISDLNNSKTLDIVGLIDGNDYFPQFEIHDSQINLNNISKIIPDNDHIRLFSGVIKRMGTALNHLFHSNFQSHITRNISLPIDMIIILSFAPIPLLNLSIPIHLFLPNNLRSVVNYVCNYKGNDNNEFKQVVHYYQDNIQHANGFICNSLKEFDEKYIEQFYQSSRNFAPIRFIGPLIFNSQQSIEDNAEDIIDWLDKQPISSVIYISFGSVARLPPTAIDIVARALLHHSFIWSLKTKTSLPSSLNNLDSNRQLILEWTPQRAILSHPSIAFFFSHGGWNSLLESMLHGKPILVWPFFGDQFDNALQVIEMGIARQVSNNLQDDIEHMLSNNSYSNKAKEVQQLVIEARENTSKKQIINIAQLISNNPKEHDEL
ncbi:unnamed protein product [Adineta steineri]|uniref:Glycosyltransferase n=1 Tax=Adineta steineri TaxID=433720 RepID=A0A818VCN2_9BILA|nr:unnamed protein product [Adineta steineri]CAF0821855.1 unnamed protein product [Adineta steineri]CAF3710630.1 unnamed protein product [Adineta steineri]